MKKGKWTRTDKWLVFFQILSVIVSIAVALIPDEILTSTIKLTIICSCIGIPIIIIQITMTVGQNEIESNIEALEETCESLCNSFEDYNDRTQQMLDLYQIYSTKNERIRRFADRRIAGIIDVLKTANQKGSSGLLDVREYYNELDFLADKLESDSGKSSIWAMTGFAPNEWSSAGGYEKAWTRRLQELSKKNIKTVRLCLLSNDIVTQIANKNLQIVHKTPIDGLVSLLKQYYQSTTSNCEHYVILNDEFMDLENKKGFFGIVLSNNEKHIILGEAVNLDNGLTGDVLFDTKEIDALYNDFLHACQPDREIIKYINDNASDEFKAYLKSQNIAL